MSSVYSGIRVVELAQGVLVPSAGCLLADHGAEVIKIERPGVGDPDRIPRAHGGHMRPDLAMQQNNRGKKSATLDLNSDVGREALQRLVGSADVFLTSWQPKALQALDLGPERLRADNPRLIYARGEELAYAGSATEQVEHAAAALWARCGLTDLLTEPGADVLTRSLPTLLDCTGAMSLLAAVASALFCRERTDEGATVETSVLRNAAWVLSSDLVSARALASYNPHRVSGTDCSPRQCAYKTSDGRWIQLGPSTISESWSEFCRLIEYPALQRNHQFATCLLRAASDDLRRLIEERIASRTWKDWLPRFLASSLSWELVQTTHEFGEDPELHAVGTVFPLKLRNGNIIEVVAGPISFNGRCAPEAPLYSPRLGEHSEEVLSSVGYEAEDLAYLRLTQVID